VVLLTQSSKSVTVPDVARQSEQAAGTRLRGAGLNPVPSLASSTTVATGLVISQSPQAGSVVEKGTSVRIVVSGGPASIPLIDVAGLSAAEATGKLRKAGFKPTTKTESSSTVAAGKVIGTEPQAGPELQVGSAVTVLVSSGPAPIKVPDVTGQSLSAAEATLTNEGLAVGTVTKKTSTQSPGTVLSQSPTSGSSLRAGGKVDLLVAKEPKQLAVPAVVGETEVAATKALEKAGFAVTVVSEPTTETSKVGHVVKQSPAAGSKAHTVTIGIGAVTPTTTTPTTTTPTTPSTPPVTPPAEAG
jgi:beta-lactam-binding protein with PASTA domain